MLQKVVTGFITLTAIFILCQCTPTTYVQPAVVRSVSCDSYTLELEPGLYWVIEYQGNDYGCYSYQPGDSLQVEVEKTNGLPSLVRILPAN